MHCASCWGQPSIPRSHRSTCENRGDGAYLTQPPDRNGNCSSTKDTANRVSMTNETLGRNAGPGQSVIVTRIGTRPSTRDAPVACNDQPVGVSSS